VAIGNSDVPKPPLRDEKASRDHASTAKSARPAFAGRNDTASAMSGSSSAPHPQSELCDTGDEK
jgi:hypothetical protein